MNTNILNKENILRQRDSHELLNYYLKPYHNLGSLKQGKHISNPFLAEKQKTPSFNIYKSTNGLWRYKDFADPNCDGDVFELIMKLKGCSFKEALQHINSDFSLGLESSVQKKFKIEFAKNWSEQNAQYWKDYGISVAQLNHYEVFPVVKVTCFKENGDPFYITATPHDPIFAYKNDADCYKLYRPFSKKYKFSWLGYKPENYVFGFWSLPESGEMLFITGGEKDALSLSARECPAICFNSETYIPKPELIQELKKRFEKIIVLYDMDQTGIQQSKKLAEKFSLHRATLPKLTDEDGKDISDFFKSGKSMSNGAIAIFPPSKSEKKPEGKYLAKLNHIQQQLSKIVATEIQEIPSLLTYKDQGVVFAQSIHLIQGKSGTHKSRLAQTLCSALLKKEDAHHPLLGFERNPETPCFVCYVDTERNITHQLPKALQEIQLDAGFSITETPRNFKYTSLVNTPRAERFEALCEFIDDIQDQTENEHLVIVLDVISDCVMDFNSTQDSLLLNDKLNEEINKREQQISFIAVIHENPSQNDGKPRGHLGTEILNKSTFTFRTAFENEKQPKASDLILIQFPKNRNGKRPDTAVMEFCETSKRLVLSDTDISFISNSPQKKKGNIGEIMEFLSFYITGMISGKTLIAELCQTFSCGDRTIRERLKELCNNYYEIPDSNGVPSQLAKIQNGREVFYQLQPIPNPNSGKKP